eukprot:364229-Chlamydomonas_euryale.AAC.5
MHGMSRKRGVAMKVRLPKLLVSAACAVRSHCMVTYNSCKPMHALNDMDEFVQTEVDSTCPAHGHLRMAGSPIGQAAPLGMLDAKGCPACLPRLSMSAQAVRKEVRNLKACTTSFQPATSGAQITSM